MLIPSQSGKPAPANPASVSPPAAVTMVILGRLGRHLAAVPLDIPVGFHG
jgi:hypothetical protein